MNERLQRESENLARSWLQHDATMLRDYLVAGVEDPRINVQSVLARHFLVIALWGSRFEHLIEHELRFAIVLNWARSVLKEAGGVEDLRAIRHALATGADNAEGWAVPRYVSTAFSALPSQVDGVAIPNYLDQVLGPAPLEPGELSLSEEVLETFQRAWQESLKSEPPANLSVVELACGSANDYRFLDAFGLARLIGYTGFDLCEKNIANAKILFPKGGFAVGNAFALPVPDRAFDYCLVQDLFEHLSLEAMERAVAEACRVTRNGLCLGFFNLHEGEEHLVQPLDDYHWNKLSVPRLRALLENHGFTVQIVHIDTFLRWRFGCDQTHNKNAYTFFAGRVRDG